MEGEGRANTSEKGSWHKTVRSDTTANEGQEKETQTCSSSTTCLLGMLTKNKHLKRRRRRTKELHTLPSRMLYTRVQTPDC